MQVDKKYPLLDYLPPVLYVYACKVFSIFHRCTCMCTCMHKSAHNNKCYVLIAHYYTLSAYLFALLVSLRQGSCWILVTQYLFVIWCKMHVCFIFNQGEGVGYGLCARMAKWLAKCIHTAENGVRFPVSPMIFISMEIWLITCNCKVLRDSH